MKKIDPLLQPNKTGLNKPLDSRFELYVYWWLLDLETAGFIKNIIIPDSIEIIKSSKIQLLEKLKTKHKKVERTLLENLSYTPDFQFEVIKEHPKLFCNLFQPVIYLEEWNKGILKICGNICVIDVKAKQYFNKFGSTDRTFQINRTILWHSESIYVNKLIPIDGTKKSLFKDSFVPQRFLYTDVGKQIRKINFPVKTLTQFLNE